MGSNSRTHPSFLGLLGDTGSLERSRKAGGPHEAQMLTPLPPMGKPNTQPPLLKRGDPSTRVAEGSAAS